MINPQVLKFERLEDRTLPAVTVAFAAKKGVLTLTGDAAGDEVRIDGTDFATEAEVLVNGLSVGKFLGVKTIRGNLGAGNDSLELSALNIGGSVDVNLGAGADLFQADTEAGGGAVTEETFIGGSVTVAFGGDAGDVAVWGVDGNVGIRIGNNVTLTGVADVLMHGDADSSEIDRDDITIGGALRISLSGQGNVTADGFEISARDVNVNGATIINGTAAAESISVRTSSFGRRVEVNLGGGDDLLDVDDIGDNHFNAAVVVDFGAGIDTLDANAGNDFAVAPLFKKGPEIFI